MVNVHYPLNIKARVQNCRQLHFKTRGTKRSNKKKRMSEKKMKRNGEKQIIKKEKEKKREIIQRSRHASKVKEIAEALVHKRSGSDVASRCVETPHK